MLTIFDKYNKLYIVATSTTIMIEYTARTNSDGFGNVCILIDRTQLLSNLGSRLNTNVWIIYVVSWWQ